MRIIGVLLFTAAVVFGGFHCNVSASTIHQAAAKGDIVLLKTLVKNNPAVAWELDERDVTPLHMASFYGRLPVVKYLLSVGAPVDSVTKSGYTPLLWAAWRKQMPVVKVLVAKGADINARSAAGMTSLHFAVQNQDVNMAKYLMSYGADKSVKDSLGQTPVDMARAAKSKSLAAVFPEISVKPKPVTVAKAEKPSVVVTRKPEAKVTIKPSVQNKPVVTVKPEPLVKITKVEPKSPVTVTVAKPRLNRSIILALLNSADMQKPEAVESIIKRNAGMVNATDQNGASMLHWLAQADWPEGIELLVSRGGDINACKIDGVTPLQVAAALGKINALNKLLELGADPAIQDNQGRTALSLAQDRGQEEAAQILSTGH